MTASLLNLEAYFERIGYTGPRAATLEVLRDLHFRHVCAIPFENLDVLLGRGIRIDLASVTQKLIVERRGGYCFEQNSLFAAVLRSIGFEVTTVAARVRWNVPAEVPTARTHMTLLVHCDGKRHLADVGFGGLSLSAPVELDTEVEQPTPHEHRRILRQNGGYLHQAKRSGQWYDVYRFTDEPNTVADYELSNWFTSTHPASRFRQNLIAARAAVDRFHTLANREFTVRHVDGRIEKWTIDTADEIVEVLRQYFGLHFPAGTRFGPAPADAPWPT